MILAETEFVLTGLQHYLDMRDEAIVVYNLTGAAADTARYKRTVKLLRNYIEEHDLEIPETEIDTMHYENFKAARIKATEKLTVNEQEFDDNLDGDYIS